MDVAGSRSRMAHEELLEKLELLKDVQTAKQQLEAGREISHEAALDQVLRGIGNEGRLALPRQ